jgi:magnesium chelatase family protein
MRLTCMSPKPTPAIGIKAYTRILKVARTCTDLDGGGPIEARHVSEAIQYRSLDRAAS